MSAREARLDPPIQPGETDPVSDLDATGRDDGTVFPQSVASGGPTPSGVLLWTRVASDARDPDEPLGVEVAPTPSFDDPPLRREIPPERLHTGSDYTVRVDLDGRLDPDSTYYYRFAYRGQKSPMGRCQTLPRPDASPDSLRLALICCQDYQNGYYGALARVAEDDVDFVVHLGDYIYESAAHQYSGLGSERYRSIRLPSGNDLASSLADFRKLYRTYMSDPHLQRLHRRHTVIRTWDDHAVGNNRYWDYEADAPVLPTHPRGDDPEFAARLTAAGIQAWWEFTPARVGYDPDADHLHDAFELYRAFSFGDLATLVLTDERLFRTPPPGAGTWRPGWFGGRSDPDQTMLGGDQRAWFLNAMRESETTWTAWANEVLFSPFQVGVGAATLRPKTDSWDGYPLARERLARGIESDATSNLVALTGDLHSYLASTMPTADGAADERRGLGPEFMTPAVTSVNLTEAVGLDEGVVGRVAGGIVSRVARAMNPHFALFDSSRWGYSVVEFTPEESSYTAYAVDKTVDSADASRSVVARLRVPTGGVEPRPMERRSG
ncbi:Alkaline phosphatase [Halogeometricum pallidum JCM 14848]|uniref:Alkaline phosphatase n=1 Tax=Halogeometricum pallidum JCM 14848 TaxID=1227487 RepID=M0D554_HALPD|nr:alkaline phosphatase D family protein [Halogeometricum pallidum]ELZ29973.1 Alkaline phosphatase [Halogeometricum pallidum JCM 14848]